MTTRSSLLITKSADVYPIKKCFRTKHTIWPRIRMPPLSDASNAGCSVPYGFKRSFAAAVAARGHRNYTPHIDTELMIVYESENSDKQSWRSYTPVLMSYDTSKSALQATVFQRNTPPCGKEWRYVRRSNAQSSVT